MIHFENLVEWMSFWEFGPEQSETNWSALLHAAKHQTTCSKGRLAHTLLLQNDGAPACPETLLFESIVQTGYVASHTCHNRTSYWFILFW